MKGGKGERVEALTSLVNLDREHIRFIISLRTLQHYVVSWHEKIPRVHTHYLAINFF
jgi:hypothetical protein